MNSSKKHSTLTGEEVSQTKQSLMQLSHRLRLQIPCELIEVSKEKFGKEDLEKELNAVDSLRLASSERVVDLLKRVEDTIKRINDGDYGLCVQCGKEIDKKTLLDDVTESMCKNCKGENPE